MDWRRDVREIALSASAAVALVFWPRWTAYVDATFPSSIAIEASVLHFALLALLATLLVMAAMPNYRRPILVVAGMLMALIVFDTVHGLRLVDPREYGWIMNGKDGRWHYIAWSFFRREPWHFPPGRITRMMYPVGTSIGNTDSAPLLAFAFKPFDSILPPDFQFFGGWFLASALLCGAFAALLWNEVPATWLYRLLAVFYFVWAEALPSFDHAARASGPCMVLASLWLYFRPVETTSRRREWWWWLMLAATSALLNPYLCVMVVVLATAALVRRCWPDRVASLPATAGRLASLMLVVLILWWLAGYFALGSYRQLNGGPLGIWSMDLLSPINPARNDAFLPEWPIGPGQYEGIHYLGAAMLASAVWALFSLCRRPPRAATIRSLLPLLLGCALLTAAALSPKITLAGKLVLQLPDELYGPLHPFRASGRFFLPVAMSIQYLLLRLLAARFRPLVATPLLSLLILLQVQESQYLFALTRNAQLNATNYRWPQSLAWDQWAALTDGRTHITLLPSTAWGEDAAVPFVYLAARAGMSSARGEAAREDTDALFRARAKADESGGADVSPDTLYVVRDEMSEEFARRPGVSCSRVDGYEACTYALDPRLGAVQE